MNVMNVKNARGERAVRNGRRMLRLMVLLLVCGMLYGCAASRVYLITVDEGSEVTISVSGFEVMKEGITEGQEPNFDVTVPVVPGL